MICDAPVTVRCLCAAPTAVSRCGSISVCKTIPLRRLLDFRSQDNDPDTRMRVQQTLDRDIQSVMRSLVSARSNDEFRLAEFPIG